MQIPSNSEFDASEGRAGALRGSGAAAATRPKPARPRRGRPAPAGPRPGAARRPGLQDERLATDAKEFESLSDQNSIKCLPNAM